MSNRLATSAEPSWPESRGRNAGVTVLPASAPASCASSVMADEGIAYQSSQEAVAGFERTTLSAGDREKIAHGNAERLLRI
jgi:hypothetical protein